MRSIQGLLLLLVLAAGLTLLDLPAQAQPGPGGPGRGAGMRAGNPTTSMTARGRGRGGRRGTPVPEEVIPAGPPPVIALGDSPVPAIHNPRVTGATPGKPFLFLIPATGEAPLTFAAQGLPEGLTLDEKTGIITGSLKKEGTTVVSLTVSGPKGKAAAKLTIIGGQRKLAQTPPMGWNSWNVWAGAVDDAKVRAAADAMVKSGLAAHGFQYINIDDTWEGTRGADGKITTNKKFPDMKALADYVHSKGLKLGIYSGPGPKTCAGYEASYQHEVADAMSYAEWGIDYLKHDWCSYGDIFNRTDRSHAEYMKPYIIMRKALDGVGRDIVYSLCQYGSDQVWTWGGSDEVGGNCWRTTGDIRDTWSSMSRLGFSESTHAPYSGPGHWNDPDMLVVGKVGWGPRIHPTNLKPDEQLTHISLWCMLSSPLLIGCDMTDMDEFTKGLLSNDEVLAINQDPLGKQAVCVDRQSAPTTATLAATPTPAPTPAPQGFVPTGPTGRLEVWARPLSDGTKAVGLFNRGVVKASIKADFAKLGFTGEQPVRDLWQKKDLGRFSDSWSATVPPHGVVLVKIGTPKAE